LLRNKKRPRNLSGWWTGNTHPVDVGERLKLVPYWCAPNHSPGRISVLIDPGPAFGVGDHPTTLMALELLEKALAAASEDKAYPSLLDVGTGTGVLSIAAKLLGAGVTVGADIDSASIFSARRNLGLNAIGNGFGNDNVVGLVIGGVEAIGGQFDIVTANLVGPLLLRLSDRLISLAVKSLVLSGIADEVVDQVVNRFNTGPLTLVERKSRDGWNALFFTQALMA